MDLKTRKPVKVLNLFVNLWVSKKDYSEYAYLGRATKKRRQRPEKKKINLLYLL